MGRRILVCGGRDFANPATKPPETRKEDVDRELALMRSVLHPIAFGPEGSDITLIHGYAKGADRAAKKMWEGWERLTEGYRADWKRHGNGAGPRRNQKMLDTGIDEVIAFPGGKGTLDMCQRSERAGVPVTRVDFEAAERET